MFELHILDSLTNNPQVNSIDNEVYEINNKISHLRTLTRQNDDAENSYKQEVESAVKYYSESSTHLQTLSIIPDNQSQYAVYLQEFNQYLYHMSQNIQQKRFEIHASMQNVISLLSEVQNVVINNRLGKWKRDQALAGNGAQFILSTLDEIQTWFRNLDELLTMARTFVNRMRVSSLPFDQLNLYREFNELYQDISKLFEDLVRSSFIVEKQPMQVMKVEKG